MLKALVLIAVLSTVFVSGCTTEAPPSQESTETPEQVLDNELDSVVDEFDNENLEGELTGLFE